MNKDTIPAQPIPTYHTDECKLSPTSSHYFIHIQLGVFQCKYCGVAKWQPTNYPDAQSFSYAISKIGIDKAYYSEIHSKRATIAIIRALEIDFAIRTNIDAETAKVVSDSMLPKARKSHKRKTQAKERLGVKRSVYNE